LCFCSLFGGSVLKNDMSVMVILLFMYLFIVFFRARLLFQCFGFDYNNCLVQIIIIQFQIQKEEIHFPVALFVSSREPCRMLDVFPHCAQFDFHIRGSNTMLLFHVSFQ
jgi:hypothetical protein